MKSIVPLIGLCLALSCSTTVLAADLPKISRQGSAYQLKVDSKPYLMLAGELHNSSASSERYMAPIWPKLKSMNLNTVITTVSWDMIEPTEGKFDFASLDYQLTEARRQNLRLVLIWFGAFKNARSTYAPGWVRDDTSRFPRSVIRGGKKQIFTYDGMMSQAVLSPFSIPLQHAESAAFAATMAHLKAVDPDHTVILVQVDNETGLLGDSRDRTALADAAWARPVPQALIVYMKNHAASLRPELATLWARQGKRETGSWSDVFGNDWQAEEVMMAWTFGQYVGNVAKAGRSQLDLPMYTNAWLGPQPGQPEAGDYPSGGPVGRVMDVWKAAAPSLDFLAPDIYVDDVKGAFANYDRADNAPFNAEAQFRTGSAFWAIGHHKALGFSVFGIEDGFPDNQLSKAYGILGSMSDMLTKAEAENRIIGVLLENGDVDHQTLGDYSVASQGSKTLLAHMLLDIGVRLPASDAPAPVEALSDSGNSAQADMRPFGLVVQDTRDSFFIVGQNLTVDFSRNGHPCEIDYAEEGHFEAGHWIADRRLNGDERLNPLPTDRIGIVHLKLLR